MLGNQRIAVVIPAYRAADTVGSVVAALPEFVDTVVVVDDACPDGTAQACAALSDPRLILKRHQHNRGVGAAMVTGFREALANGADVVVKLDADGQMDPGFMGQLLAPVVQGGFDYAKGNRFYDYAPLSRMPLLRRWGNVALSFLTKVASGYWNVYDPQNGYIAIRREMLERLDLDSLSPRFFFENSLLIQLNIVSARVAEVPMPARYGSQRSSLALGRILLSFPWRLLCGCLTRIRLKYFGMDFSPVAVLLIAGALLLFGGMAYGFYAWWDHARRGIETPAGTVMLAALPLLIGVQMLLHALLLDIAQTPPGLGIRKIAGCRPDRRRLGEVTGSAQQTIAHSSGDEERPAPGGRTPGNASRGPA